MRKLELEKRHTKQKQMLLDSFDKKMEQIKSLHNKQMNKEHNKVKVSHLTFKSQCYFNLYTSDSSCVSYVYVSLHFMMLKITRMLLTN